MRSESGRRREMARVELRVVDGRTGAPIALDVGVRPLGLREGEEGALDYELRTLRVPPSAVDEDGVLQNDRLHGRSTVRYEPVELPTHPIGASGVLELELMPGDYALVLQRDEGRRVRFQRVDDLGPGEHRVVVHEWP